MRTLGEERMPQERPLAGHNAVAPTACSLCMVRTDSHAARPIKHKSLQKLQLGACWLCATEDAPCHWLLLAPLMAVIEQ